MGTRVLTGLCRYRELPNLEQPGAPGRDSQTLRGFASEDSRGARANSRQACPAIQAPKRMYSSDDNLSGRKERRLPIIVVVRLTPLQHAAEGDERTYTDNLSAHGLRVHSRRCWSPGEQVEIIPVKEQTPVRGEVVYCEKFDNQSFVVGFKFPQSRLRWSIWQRFDGIY